MFLVSVEARDTIDRTRANTERRGEQRALNRTIQRIQSRCSFRASIFQRAMPFLAPFHRCRNISAPGLINGDKRKKTLVARGREARRLSTSRAHLCTCTKAAGRFHVLDAFRHMNLAEAGARPGRRRPRGAKRRETSKNSERDRLTISL